jgi:hypothetical protein
MSTVKEIIREQRRRLVQDFKGSIARADACMKIAIHDMSQEDVSHPMNADSALRNVKRHIDEALEHREKFRMLGDLLIELSELQDKS